MRQIHRCTGGIVSRYIDIREVCCTLCSHTAAYNRDMGQTVSQLSLADKGTYRCTLDRWRPVGQNLI